LATRVSNQFPTSSPSGLGPLTDLLVCYICTLRYVALLVYLLTYCRPYIIQTAESPREPAELNVLARRLCCGMSIGQVRECPVLCRTTVAKRVTTEGRLYRRWGAALKPTSSNFGL